MKIRRESGCFMQTERQTDMIKPIAAFCSFAITPNNREKCLTQLLYYKTINFDLKNSSMFVTDPILIRIIINLLRSIVFLSYINNLWSVT